MLGILGSKELIGGWNDSQAVKATVSKARMLEQATLGSITSAD